MDGPALALCTIAALAAGTVVGWIARGRSRRPTSVEDVPVAFGRVLDALEEAVLILGVDGVILYSNAACARFFPTANGFLRKPISSLGLAGEAADAVTAALVEKENRSVRISEGVPGDVVWQFDVTALETPQQGVAAIILITDDTERAITEQIRQEFVANASHELRTPLAIISGYIETLINGAMEDPEITRRFLKIIRKHTLRITRLVEDMLSISKIESREESVIRSKPFSLVKCINRVIDHLQVLIEEKKAHVEILLAPEAERMVGDRFYWEQIFFNLIENALKNNPPGALTVQIESRVDIDGSLVLSVADNGSGIPKSALPFIFKRFYRVENGDGPEVPGTGLGLSIVRRAVEAHEGTISVRSEPGVRTIFTMRLPPTVLQGSAADWE